MEAQKVKKGDPRKGTGGDINAMELDSILVDRLNNLWVYRGVNVEKVLLLGFNNGRGKHIYYIP